MTSVTMAMPARTMRAMTRMRPMPRARRRLNDRHGRRRGVAVARARVSWVRRRVSVRRVRIRHRLRVGHAGRHRRDGRRRRVRVA